MKFIKYPLLALAVTMLVSAHAGAGVNSPSPQAASPHRVAYSAPVECPDAESLQQNLGEPFQVCDQQESACVDCEVSITIVAPRHDSEPYRLTISGLENEPAEQRDCSKLLNLAVFTLHSSLFDPLPTPPPVDPLYRWRVGVFGGHEADSRPFDSQFFAGAHLELTLGPWSLRPNASWLTPKTVPAPAGSDRQLDLSGYSMGVDVCWRALEALHVCGLGLRQTFSLDLGTAWTPIPASQLMFGAGLTLRAAVAQHLSLELQPALMFAPRSAVIHETDQSQVIYERSALQVLIRVGVSFGFGDLKIQPNVGAEQVVSKRTRPRQLRRMSNSRETSMLSSTQPRN